MNRGFTHSPAGFTLVETIIYLALLTILMSGAVASFYSIEKSSAQDGQDATAATEGSFVIAKIDWALDQASSVAAPRIGQESTLTLHTRDPQLDPIVISIDESEILMREGDSDAAPITTANVSAPGLTFAALTDASGAVIGVAASFVLDGVTFLSRRYLFP